MADEARRVSLDAILEARLRVGERVHRPPILTSETAARVAAAAGTSVADGRLYLKAEHLQKTGSFKPLADRPPPGASGAALAGASRRRAGGAGGRDGPPARGLGPPQDLGDAPRGRSGRVGVIGRAGPASGRSAPAAALPRRATAARGPAQAGLPRAARVVVDDIGLLPAGADEAEALYRLVDAAYEKRSLILTSNLRPGSTRSSRRAWPQPRSIGSSVTPT